MGRGGSGQGETGIRIGTLKFDLDHQSRKHMSTEDYLTSCCSV